MIDLTLLKRLSALGWFVSPRQTCENIENTPETARLQKILAKDHSNGLGTLKKENGTLTNSTQETLELMMRIHFPCSAINSTEDQSSTVVETGVIETRTYG